MGPTSYIYCSVAADRQATKRGQTCKNVWIAQAPHAYADKFANIRRVSSFMKAISADEMSCMARR